ARSVSYGLLRVVGGRVAAVVPVAFGVTLLVFLLNAVALGDPARATMGQRGDPEVIERIRRDYALDRPLVAQYSAWMLRLTLGDLGHSYQQRRPAPEILVERAPATLRLALAATLISVLVGVVMGALAARRPGSLVDHAIMATAVLGISTPVFWLGMMLSLVFAVTLCWLPVSGYGAGDVPHLELSALPLGAPP